MCILARLESSGGGKNRQIVANWKTKRGSFKRANFSKIRPNVSFGINYDSFSLLCACRNGVKKIFLAADGVGNR